MLHHLIICDVGVGCADSRIIQKSQHESPCFFYFMFEVCTFDHVPPHSSFFSDFLDK